MTEDFSDIGHTFSQDVLARLAGWVGKYQENCIDELIVRGFDHIKKVPSSTAITYVSTHRSEVDYMLEAYALRSRKQNDCAGKPVLAIAAGDNLFVGEKLGDTVLNIGKFWRNCGAFKILRDVPKEKATGVTKHQLNYITHRMAEGDHFLTFAGIGRSYNGEFKPFDSAAVHVFSGAAERANKQHVFIPVDISYERVPEATQFPFFAEYKRNKAEGKHTLWEKAQYYIRDWPYILWQGVRGRSLGNVTISFGVPMQSEGRSRHQKDQFVRDLETAAKKLVPITSTALVCAALRDTYNHEGSCRKDDVSQRMIRMQSAIDNTHPTLHIEKAHPAAMIERSRRFIGDHIPLKDGRFIINNHDLLNYYANSIKHYTQPWQSQTASQL